MEGSGTNPFRVLLPKSAGLGDLSASMDSLVKNVAWQLGELYDSVLSAQPFPLGPGWLMRLGDYRGRQVLRLHDPSFVFSEPEIHSDSVVWCALPPRTRQLCDQLMRARTTRNYWQHDAAGQDLNKFGDGVRRYRELCASIGLVQQVEQCDRLIERVNHIRTGGSIRTGLDPQVVEAMKDRAREAEREAERVRKELAELEKALKERQGADAEEEQRLVREIERQREALDRSREEARELAERLHGMLQEERLRMSEPAEELAPGEDWTVPTLGVRLLDLQPKMIDLVDMSRRLLLPDEMGTVANEAAKRWLQFMPGGGQVHMTEGGHAAGLVAGRWVYLGRLDFIEPAASEPTSAGSERALMISGTTQDEQLVGYMYELTPDANDVFEYTTEKLLSQFFGAADARSVAERLVGDIDVQEVFWTRLDGTVLIRRGGLMQKASEVDMEYWFPYRKSTRRMGTAYSP